MRFIGDQSFSFYNVDKPQEGTDQEELDSYFLNQQKMRNIDNLTSAADHQQPTADNPSHPAGAASPQSTAALGSGATTADPDSSQQISSHSSRKQAHHGSTAADTSLHSQ